MTASVSVVIPTLNAGLEIGGLLDSLLSQTVVPDEILVVDSSSEDATQDIVASYAGRGVSLDVIERAEFNHGATRDRAFMRTVGDYTLFMTQDAVPAGDCYIERLTAPLRADKAIALVSGRQLPKPDARRFEQLVRAFNYPDEPSVRGAEDLIPMTDLLLGSTCTTRLRCLSSRSDVVLVGKSRWAGVSASASYGISAALGQKLYIWAVTSRWSPLTSPRSRSVNTDFRIPSAAPFFCLVGALPAALRIRCAMQRCHASPG